MPTYEYHALDVHGKSSRGSVTAESPAAARRLLRTRRLHATNLRPVSELSKIHQFEWGNLFKGRRRRTVLEFTRQLATMVGAEVQLTESLGVLIAQSEDKHFAQVLQNIRDAVLAGDSFADGLKEYPHWFDAIYVAMVRVGEMTGNLGRSLQLLGNYIGKRQRLEAKVKNALAYPLILVIISIVVTIILMTAVVPRITSIIIKSGQEIPFITAVLIGVSDFMLNYWWLLLGIVIVAIWLFRRSLATPTGRLAFDRFLLKIPVLGHLFKQNIVARFATTLAALIRSGMPMADSLQIVAEVTGNSVLSRAIYASRERIIAGADVATPLRESQVVGPAVAHMIAVGERTGELEAMLVTIADSLEENTDITVQRISSVLEPLIIVAMAVVVGFIVVGTLLPMLKITEIVQK